MLSMCQIRCLVLILKRSSLGQVKGLNSSFIILAHPPHTPPPPNSFKTNADPPPQPMLPKQFVLACSKLGLRVQATSSPSRKSSGWKEYGKWKRPVALVVNPTGYMMLW